MGLFDNLGVSKVLGGLFGDAPEAPDYSGIANANAAINAALKEKSVIDSLAIVGLMPHGSTPEEQARWQKAEYDSWGPLIKKIGFTAES